MTDNIKIGRRDFLVSAIASGFGCCVPAAEPARFDDSLSVLISDMHVGGPGSNRVHQKGLLSATVGRILEMRPLPRRVIGFGDLAFLHGLKCDYEMSYPIMKRLTDAGIEVYNGLGNHDRRPAFFDCYPDEVKKSLVPGYAVYRIETPHVDFVMLDSLNDRSEGGTGGGRLSDAQQEWLKAELPRWSRPVLVGAHHGGYELKLGRYSLHGQLARMPAVKGYVFGHVHRWSAGYAAGYGWGGAQRVLRTVSLPSLGYWGDIGWAEFRTEPDKATLTLRQNDFFFARPVGWGEGVKTRPPEWDDIVAANRGASCVFRFK